MMFIGALEIDLPKARYVLWQFPLVVRPERVIVFNIIVKTQLSSRKEAYGDVWLSNCRKAAGERVTKLG